MNPCGSTSITTIMTIGFDVPSWWAHHILSMMVHTYARSHPIFAWLVLFFPGAALTSKPLSRSLSVLSDLAGNYSDKALRAATGLLIINVVIDQKFRYLDLVAHCNSMDIVKQSNSLSKPRPEKQVHANVIVLSNQETNPWTYVKAQIWAHVWPSWWRPYVGPTHNDPATERVLGFAYQAMLHGCNCQQRLHWQWFPFEYIVPFCYSVACKLFHSMRIVYRPNFNQIHLDGMRIAMCRVLVVFRRWIAEHMCIYCRQNKHLSHYMSGVDNICLASVSKHQICIPTCV